MAANKIIIVAASTGGPKTLQTLFCGMPRLNGIETLKRLRETSKVPVLLVTGYPVEQISDQLTDIVNVSLLQKPFHIKELKGKMQEIAKLV